MSLIINVRRNVGLKLTGGMILAFTQSLLGQTGDTAAPEKTVPTPKQEMSRVIDNRPYQIFNLTNIGSQNDANELLIATRNILPPDVKMYLVPNQNSIVMKGSTEELAQAQKIINELNRPKKTYRLIYTVTETDAGKRVGIQHFSMVLVTGQRTVLKQGSKVPIATGSYSATGASGAQTQITYIDVGMNFDATVDELGDGGRLRTKVEQLSVAEQTSGVGLQDPVIRQSALEGTSSLTLGKPLVLGSMDIPGSTRHLDVEVVIESIR